MYDLRNRFRSLRTSVRLSLQFSMLYAVLSALVFIAAYWFTDFEVRDWVSDQMRGDAGTFAAIHAEQGAAGLQSRIAALADVSFENTRIYQLQNAQADIVAGNIVTILSEDIGSFFAADALELRTPIDDEVSGYWMRQDQIGSYTLFQGSGNHIVAEVMEAVGIALGVGYLIVVGLGLLLGVRVGQATERRITQISETLAVASRSDLSARVPRHQNENDDLSRISIGINAALDQLKRLLESQEQISNDIAHDLRTPLQRLRQRLEFMRDSDVASGEDIDGALQQVEGIIGTFNALLRIAQIEARDRRARFDEVDLNKIIENVVDLYEPAAEDKTQNLTFAPSSEQTRVQGDANMLTQLFANLVENALRHCPKGASITVSTEIKNGRILASVADNGPGILPDDRQRVFERFVRTDSSRSSSGNGLGLTLAKAIAEMHGASITIKDREIGTEFLIAFDA